MIAALGLVAVSLLYLLCRGSGGNQKKRKLPVTLQDATVKYPLRLIDKEVDWNRMQTYERGGCIAAAELIYAEEA